MIEITCVESTLDQNGKHFCYFVLQPLDLGHGITVGNALRRCLLADLYGCAIGGVRINDVRHEFGSISGIKEEPLEILVNLKKIIFKKNFQEKMSKKRIRAFLNVKGPILVTAAMFHLPKNILKILNPRQYICAVLTSSELFIEVDIETGKGYRLIDYCNEKNYKRSRKFLHEKGRTMLVDSLFNPILLANYKIKLVHDSFGNLKESLHFEITTNGSLSPYRALLESTKYILNLFTPILITANFLKITSEIKVPYKLTLKRYKEDQKKQAEKYVENLINDIYYEAEDLFVAMLLDKVPNELLDILERLPEEIITEEIEKLLEKIYESDYFHEYKLSKKIASNSSKSENKKNKKNDKREN